MSCERDAKGQLLQRLRFVTQAEPNAHVRVAYHRRTTFSTANVVKRVLDAGGGEFYSCLFAELAAQMLEFKAQPFDVSAIMICRGDC